MKANEFVKKFGYKHNAVNLKYLPLNQHAELERLVESHELVALFDDIDCAKAWINDLCEDYPYQVKGSDIKFFKWQLKQAILDVESCNE